MFWAPMAAYRFTTRKWIGKRIGKRIGVKTALGTQKGYLVRNRFGHRRQQHQQSNAYTP